MEALVAMPRCFWSADNGYGDDLERGNANETGKMVSQKLRLAMAVRGRPVAVRTWPPGCGPNKMPVPVAQESNNVVVLDDSGDSSSGYQSCKDSGIDSSVSFKQEKSQGQDHPADTRKIILVDDDDSEDKGLEAENFGHESLDAVNSPPTPQTLRDYKSWEQLEASYAASMLEDPFRTEENNLRTGKDLNSQYDNADSIAVNLMNDCIGIENGEICPEVCTDFGKERATDNIAGNEAADMAKDEQLEEINALKRKMSVPSFLAQFGPRDKQARTKLDSRKQRLNSQLPKNRDSSNRPWHGKGASLPPDSRQQGPPIPSLKRLSKPLVLSRDGSYSSPVIKPLPAQKISSVRPLVSDIRKSKASVVVERSPPSCDDNESEEDEVDHGTSSDDSRALVIKTLKTFEKLRRKYQQQEEAKHDKIRRADLRAGSEMKKRSMWVNRKARIGPVPGVEVGDQFYYRSEIHIIGLHQQIQSGISCLNAEHSEYVDKVAISVVASGGYEDDKDTGDVLTYTGQGGNDYRSGRRQNANQELLRGNLGMVNSYNHQLPIRVIRGCPDKKSPSAKIYSYDGLYRIRKFWVENGAAGFKVYQFELVRLPGQQELGSRVTVFAAKLKRQPSNRVDLVKKDLSEGKELVPIPVVNPYGKDLPNTFKYVCKMVLSRNILLGKKPPKLKGCRCKGRCWDFAACDCIKKNGGMPYTHDGALVETKNIVYECGPDCGCPETCYNRVSQKGGTGKFNLEVFKTKEKGWGVRSWDTIPAGSFICEYLGELLDSDEAEKRVGRDVYLFDIDCIKGNQDRGVDISCFFEDQNPSIPNSHEEFHDAHMSVDAATCGNVARFINHSCNPNVFVQCVFWDHEDLRRPHLMMFAMDNIKPFTEFSYDYNYTIGSVRYPDGREKVKLCHCGAQNCRGRLY